MATQKVQFFFVQGNAGWSETHYISVASVEFALVKAVNVILERVNLLGGGGPGGAPELRQVRVSDIAVQRDSVIFTVPPGDRVPRNPVGLADIVHTGLLLRLNSTPLYRRSLIIRGFPDLLITDNGIYVAVPAYTALIQMYLTKLRDNGFGILAAQRPPAPTPILLVDTDGGPPGAIRISTAVAHGLVSQDRIRIVSAPGVKQFDGRPLRGRFFVSRVNDFLFVLLGTSGGVGITASYTGGGTFYKITPTLQVYTDANILRATHRITGRPFDTPVGAHRR